MFLVKSHDFVDDEQSEYLCSKFKEMYKGFAQDLQSNLDVNELGLSKEYFVSETSDGTLKGKKSKLFTEIAMKWNALELGIKEIDREIVSSELRGDRVAKRIEFVMDLFDRYFLKEFVDGKGDGKISDNVLYIDIMAECLSDYDGIALIDDLNYIRDHEGDIRSVIGTYCDRIDGDDGSGECIGEMMRKYRESERTKIEDDTEFDGKDIGFKEFVNGLGLRERNLLETSTKIHSLICHQIHDEDGDEKEDGDQDEVDGIDMKQQSKEQMKGRTEALSSKFVNEVETEKKSENIEVKRMEDLADSLRANGLSDGDCTRLVKMLLAQNYDSETIIDDLVDEEADPSNLYPDSNLFPILQNNLFLAKTTKKHFGSKRNDDDPIPPFTFGRDKLYHWEYFKDRPGYVGAPKHMNLKKECLRNRIHAMSMEQFSRMLFAAFLLRKSVKGRELRAMDVGGDNERYEVPVDCPLSVSHIFVLLMYCNDTDLQYKYKKFGCRERDSEQTLEELKDWNRDIAHWHKLLNEAVIFFGNKVRQKQVFFTGLNVKLSFQTFAPLFMAPFSTTTSVDVANRFCGSDGLILMLTPRSGSDDVYFNVEWLSDFDHEKERLFVSASNVKIGDIQYFEGGYLRKNRMYLSAFSIFSSLFAGHFVSSLLRMRKNKKQQRAWNLLLDLITVYKATNGIGSGQTNALNIGIPLYIQQLFFHLLDGFRMDKYPKYVIKSNFDLLDETLSRELIAFSEHITDDYKVTLSPLMMRLCQKERILVMKEYLWMINGAKFNELQNAKSTKRIFSEMHQYRVPNLGNISFVFMMIRKVNGSTNAGFGIMIEKTPFPVNGAMSVEIDEVKWNIDCTGFLGIGKGGYSSSIAFKDSLFAKIDTLTVKVALYLVKAK